MSFGSGEDPVALEEQRLLRALGGGKKKAEPAKKWGDVLQAPKQEDGQAPLVSPRGQAPLVSPRGQAPLVSPRGQAPQQQPLEIHREPPPPETEEDRKEREEREREKAKKEEERLAKFL
eukprot:TRINITY_DN21_c0_g1_i1.p1 TRINITY_DN21_c0_g1~~TRINITY_DN21_c0_g1_i1.p1  ORF type:complete len:119 (+),score=55.54 TRINITY_DN21_c0_g1_i1:89-445(+)